VPTEYTQFGADKFPNIEWHDLPQGTKEILVVVEDPDAPLLRPVMHGLYYAIDPRTTHRLDQSDLDRPAADRLFSLGRNLRGTLYSGPRPVTNHGPHRYFYQVVAL
jgi:phosphatidylethanolamine-binding protein (PEBP) family uncharacterized protein